MESMTRSELFTAAAELGFDSSSVTQLIENVEESRRRREDLRDFARRWLEANDCDVPTNSNKHGRVNKVVEFLGRQHATSNFVLGYNTGRKRPSNADKYRDIEYIGCQNAGRVNVYFWICEVSEL